MKYLLRCPGCYSLLANMDSEDALELVSGVIDEKHKVEISNKHRFLRFFYCTHDKTTNLYAISIRGLIFSEAYKIQ